jgi:hypothetical protein
VGQGIIRKFRQTKDAKSSSTSIDISMIPNEGHCTITILGLSRVLLTIVTNSVRKTIKSKKSPNRKQVTPESRSLVDTWVIKQNPWTSPEKTYYISLAGH